jgi:hypothetical protein
MNCQRNVNSILPTQLPHKFSYILAIFIHNHFESSNIILPNSMEKKLAPDHIVWRNHLNMFKNQKTIVVQMTYLSL